MKRTLAFARHGLGSRELSVASPNFNEVDKGGHFAAQEQPELLAQEVRAAFKSLR